jgi:hypothetical protein
MEKIIGRFALTGNHFIEMANSFYNSIKFTVKMSFKKIRFWIPQPYLRTGKSRLTFTLNPTDSHLYIKLYNFHQPHSFKDVRKGLATFMLCICCSPTSFQEEGNTLKNHLDKRGNKPCKVLIEIDEIARQDHSQYKERSQNDRVLLIATTLPSSRTSVVS